MRVKIQPRFWMLCILIMVIVFGIFLLCANHDLRVGSEKLDEATVERTELQSELQSLQEELEYVQTDDYVIRVARDELGMLMPGEVRYVSED